MLTLIKEIIYPPVSGFLPESLLLIVIMFALAGLVFAFILLAVLFFTWMERKVSAHIQSRLGPMYTGGWHGWMQPLADGIKLLTKEDIVPAGADRALFILAPFLVLGSAFAVYVALPLGGRLFLADLNIGIYYILAISSLGAVGIIMAGWASNNKWSLLGAMRSAAQIVSYEVPVALCILTVVVIASSLSLREIVEAQAGGIYRWFIFRNPFTFLAFGIYFLGSLAEVNRNPFDMPEAESELVAGFHTEYSGIRFSLFFLAEYANMLAVSLIAAILFLGGWYGPLVDSEIPGALVLILKALFLVFVQMWLRFTLPRLRVDQLMHVCWKVFVPLAFLSLIGASVLELV